MVMKNVGFAMFAAATLMIGGMAQAANLPIGEVTAGDTENGEYTFTCEEPGLLVLVVRADDDVFISVTDADGNDVPGGSIDGDIDGDVGAEQAVVTLSQPGEYTVTILGFDGDANFSFFAGWASVDLSDLLN